jgi:Protein of unknown function (DUF1592)/Protein of unknown function (DUF1588)/Protein of unknown function (DUF1585)/Protein of unknown function (DUF1587)/Protein of unknown function (DUF1595)
MRVLRAVALWSGVLALPCWAATPARRLNRYEYDCTVRDLLGVDFQSGFDTDADALTVTPAVLAKYLDAAKKIARAAVEPVPPPAAPELDRRSNPSALRDIMWQRNFTWEADYDLHVAIAGRGGPLETYLSVDGADPQRLQTSFNFEGRRYADARLHFGEGQHDLRVYVLEGNHAYPEFVEVRGPYGPVFPAIPRGYRSVFACGHVPGQHNAACLRTNLARLAERAWRRPVSPAEIDKLVRLSAAAPAELQQEMEAGIEAILVSPFFLFRFENRLGQFELASRLSYFLWSSLPDDELLRAAQQGQLNNPALLAAQARRMLADPRSRALSENFAARWLEFGNLAFVHRDPARFPEFTVELRDSMRQETELFVANVIHEDRSILDFLNAKYTFVNEPLAKLYGIPGVEGARFRKVSLEGVPREGILTQASVLTVTSYATRTSPVLRGKWILENILNDPPPPPPANVPALRDVSSEPDSTLRQQLEQHRSNTACSGCHASMDTLGLGLENLDAIGRWRTHEGTLPVDPAGKLPDGSSFSNPAELAAILASRPEGFARCIVEKLLTYALGRNLDLQDRDAARQIAQNAAPRNYRFADLILGVVNSPVFRDAKDSHE